MSVEALLELKECFLEVKKQLFLGNKFLVFGASMIYWYAMRFDDLLYNGCASTLQTYVDNNDNNNNQDNDNIDVHCRHTMITMMARSRFAR